MAKIIRNLRANKTGEPPYAVRWDELSEETGQSLPS